MPLTTILHTCINYRLSTNSLIKCELFLITDYKCHGDIFMQSCLVKSTSISQKWSPREWRSRGSYWAYMYVAITGSMWLLCGNLPVTTTYTP